MIWIALIIPILSTIAVALYAYFMDKVDKEPWGLLLGLFGLGVLGYGVSFAVVEPLRLLNTWIFSNAFGDGSSANLVFYSPWTYTLYYMFDRIIITAFFQEIIKFLILFFVTRNSPHFSSLYDGIIYSIFLALGFAICETVVQALILKNVYAAFTTYAQLQFVSSVIIGIAHGRNHVLTLSEETEIEMIHTGIIRNANGWLIEPANPYFIGLPIAILVHGVSIYLLDLGSVGMVLFILLVIGLFVGAVVMIAIYSKRDDIDQKQNRDILNEKY